MLQQTRLSEFQNIPQVYKWKPTNFEPLAALYNVVYYMIRLENIKKEPRPCESNGIKLRRNPYWERGRLRSQS